MELTAHDLLRLSELIALAPRNINDADADGHGRKNKDQYSRAKGIRHRIRALAYNPAFA